VTVTVAVPLRRAALVLAAALLALGAAGQTSPTSSSTVAPEPHGPFTVTHDVRYGTAGGQDLLLDTYVPDDKNAERVSVFLLHGGGWRLGDKRDVVDFATRMAQRGWVVFAVNYRLDVPEAFPAEIDDVQTAVKWARLHAYDYRLDPGLMGALGFSAGGHLAAMLATSGDGPPDRNARILVGASWSGPMDLTALAAGGGEELSALSALLLPCPPATCPERWDAASPISHVDPTDAALLIANSSDELVPVDQARAMAARLDADRVPNQLVIVPGPRHGQDLGDDVWRQTVTFLDHYLTRPEDLRDPNPTWGTWVLVAVIVVVVTGGVIGGLRVRRRLNQEAAG
jgi:acetyl esterase/lipase